MSPESPVKILALLGEMARCLNQNLSKVRITPIDSAFTVSPTTAIATPLAQSSQD